MNRSITQKMALKPLSVCLSAAILAACGGTAQNPGNPDNSSTPTSSSPVSSSSTANSSSSVWSSSSVQSSSTQSSSSTPSNGIPSILSSGGTFDSGPENFGEFVNPGTSATFSYNGQANINITSIAAAPEVWHVQFQHLVSINAGQQYTICYKAKADTNRPMNVNIDTGDAPDYASLIPTGPETVNLSSGFQNFDHTFTANTTDITSRLLFNVGDSTVNVQLDDIGIFEGSQCGTPGQTSGSNSSGGNGSGNIEGVPPITTQGNQVLFGGQPGSIAGMSLFWSNRGWGGEKYYNADAVAYIKNNWNAKLIRAAMGVDPTTNEGLPSGAYLDNSNNNSTAQLNMVKTVVDAAIANDMYVIIDWHSHHAEQYLSEAVQFFGEMSALYGDYNNVIFEVYNEPLQVSWSQTIKPYAESVIQAIRSNDPDNDPNLVIVGTPSWSQDVDQAAQDPINDVNVAYTLHFYAATGAHQGPLRDKARIALNAGIPLFVTEWGSVEADGNGAVNESATRAWMDFLYQNNISHANWALNDKLEGASALQPGASPNGGWSDNDLTTSGRLIKDIIQNW